MTKFKNIERILQRISFAVYAILIITMAIATFVDNSMGVAVAKKNIYHSWWFLSLWFVAIATSLSCLPKHFRWLLHLFHKLKRKLFFICFFLFLPTSIMATGVHIVERAQADSLRSVQVIYNNRLCPLNTPARDFIVKLSGDYSFQGLTAEQVMLSWISDPKAWNSTPIIQVKQDNLKAHLGIDGTHACFSDFFDKNGIYLFSPGQYPDIEEKLTLILLLTRGSFFEWLPKGVQPLPCSKVKAELFYNDIPWNPLLFSSCFALAFIIFCLHLKNKATPKKIHYTILITKISLTILLSASLAIRWYISGHIPLSNTYETLQVIALTALAISCFMHSNTIAALIVAGSTLLVAHISALDPQVTSLMPILQSPWLSSHVTTIMISYCLFALLLVRPNRTMLIWAEILLATGIILGAIWAKTAWGAYWHWDSKETWALITLLIYMYPLHPGILPWFRSERNMKLYLRLAFLSVLMTYFGCNYLLTGMHSYAGN